MRAAAALNQAQHGFHFLYVNLEFNICRAVSMMSCVTIQDVRNRANKFFSVNKSLDSSEKSGLKSGQITGSTLFWISACLGSHQPSLFSTSAWIPLQVIGEQVLGFIFFWSRCNKDPLLYLTLVLLSWICHLHQAQRAKDAARQCHKPSTTRALWFQTLACYWSRRWNLFGPFYSCSDVWWDRLMSGFSNPARSIPHFDTPEETAWPLDDPDMTTWLEQKWSHAAQICQAWSTTLVPVAPLLES